MRAPLPDLGTPRIRLRSRSATAARLSLIWAGPVKGSRTRHFPAESAFFRDRDAAAGPNGWQTSPRARLVLRAQRHAGRGGSVKSSPARRAGQAPHPDAPDRPCDRKGYRPRPHPRARGGARRRPAALCNGFVRHAGAARAQSSPRADCLLNQRLVCLFDLFVCNSATTARCD